jgi:hypothetical protein
MIVVLPVRQYFWKINGNHKGITLCVLRASAVKNKVLFRGQKTDQQKDICTGGGGHHLFWCHGLFAILPFLYSEHQRYQ